MNTQEAYDAGYLACILDDARGIYIPQAFIENFEGWDGIDDEDAESLRNGPDDEFYWDAWDNVLNNATYTEKDGSVWGLWQDGDLFAVRVDIDIEWED